MDNNALEPGSPFYRVTVKGIIKDNQDRLLVVKHEEGHYEMPGGGWEHGESQEACLRREMQEEIGLQPVSIGDVLFVYATESIYGYMTLRIAVAATIAEFDIGQFTYGDGIVAAHFVAKDELRQLPFAADEAGIQNFASQIWPN